MDLDQPRALMMLRGHGRLVMVDHSNTCSTLSLLKTSSTRASLVIPAARWAETTTVPAVGDADAIAAAFAGHSLRAGCARSAAENGAPGHAIQRQLGHRSFNTTVGYIRSDSLFKGNAASFALLAE
jgi:integrase